MDYEKLYKEALERASKYYNANTNKGYREIFEDIFHEFKESEDERIRKEIIEVFKSLGEGKIPANLNYADIFTWLEKQGENELEKYINDERNKKDFYCEGKEMSWNEMSLDVRKHDYPYYFKGNLDCYPFNVERQGEQKPIEQDTEIRDLWVYIREWNDKFGRLPKDEDELASCIDYVMKRQKPADKVEQKHAWSEKHIADVFEKVGLARIVRRQGNDQLTNAVQSAMIELSKQQNPAYSEEDRKHIDNIISLLNQTKERFVRESGQFPSWITEILWLESIKDRVQPQLTQEWNEEDEEMYKEVLTDIIYAKNDLKTKRCLELSKRAMKAFNWFSKRYKSLRPQSKWKPSEEQLRAIINSAQGLYQCKEKEVLLDLYEQLKNL